MAKYIIHLSKTERDFLMAIINKGSHTSQTFRNACILLNCANLTYGTDDYFAPANVRYITNNPSVVQCPSNPGNVKPPTSRIASSGTEGSEAAMAQAGFDVVIYPNPGSNDFNLSIAQSDETDLDISISDMAGKIVYQNKHHVANAWTHFEIDVANGIYMVKIHDLNTQQYLVKKLVVQK